MANQDRYGAPQKRKGRRRSLFAPLSVVLVAVAIVFGMGVFFRVQTIEVVGAVSYTDEEVIEASGISEGDNLFFINQMNASSRIFFRLSLVESATIARSLPNKITITIEESSALAYVDWEGQYWMMTANCKLLGSVTAEELSGLIHVRNITPESPTAGEIMTVSSDESLKLSYLQELLGAMEDLGMIGDVTEVNMENAASPTFEYLGRFTVKMGSNDNTEYKLRMILSAMEQIDSDVTGSIDVSDGTAVHVTPD
ncbi:MAG: FtsQ-type POTRA domain-containing protein [Oscillospiraceae bacterium]|nr:FtsQ-type POTRA domain-containing protein [Oscillospiraceae bacterium]